MNIKEAIQSRPQEVSIIDAEIILSSVTRKSREFLFAHPEFDLKASDLRKFNKFVKLRKQRMPIAQIIGHKEFFGLNFTVNQHTLIPRPETELLVESALSEAQASNLKFPISFIDVGTGSGNIITSIAHAIKNDKNQNPNFKFIGIDISKEALKIAKQNAKIHKVNNVKFIESDLLSSLIGNCPPAGGLEIGNSKTIVLANLPYLSKEIYKSAPIDVKKYEPKSALYSAEHGLSHYKKLLEQVKLLVTSYQLPVTCFLEISPEQKKPLPKIIKSILPNAKIAFFKDLAGKWRVCKITL